MGGPQGTGQPEGMLPTYTTKTRSVGCEGELKRWRTVWLAELQLGQVGSSARTRAMRSDWIRAGRRLT